MQFLTGVNDRRNFQRNCKDARAQQTPAVIRFKCQTVSKMDITVRESGANDPLIADECAPNDSVDLITLCRRTRHDYGQYRQGFERKQIPFHFSSAPELDIRRIARCQSDRKNEMKLQPLV